MNCRILFISLGFLALFCLHTTALSLFEGSFLRKTSIMNAVTTSSSGVIDLKKESNSSSTFYVEADISSSSEKDIVKMMISLVNDETMVAEDCLGFSSYDCSQYNCKKQGSTKTISFPWFNATAEVSQSELYLDYKYWILGSSPLYIAKSCLSGDNLASFGSGFSGVLGLGTALKKSDDSVFSIFIKSDLSSGKLIFKDDADGYAHSETPEISFSVNTNWTFSAYPVEVGLRRYPLKLVGFDINSDAIGIPDSSWKTFISGLNNSDIWCNDDNYRPYCYTWKELKELPLISIRRNFFSDPIKIVPEIYTTLDKDTGEYKYFYLNLKAISPSLTGKNYVSPALKDYILLDANFMRYYYIVFDGRDSYKQIRLYKSINTPKPKPTPRPNPNPNPKTNSDRDSDIMYFCVISGIMVVGVCCYAYCCNDQAKRNLENEIIDDYSAYQYHNNPTPYTNNLSPAKYDQQQAKSLYQAYS